MTATTTAPTRVLALGELSDADLAAWEQLTTRSGSGYFTGPVWATSWYECFGEDAPNRVAWWGSEAAPEAVAALVRIAEPVLPAGTFARLRLPAWHQLGAGPASADHLGFPSTAERRDDVLAWVLARPGSVRLSNLDRVWAVPLARAGLRSPQRTRTYAVSIADEVRPGSKKLWKHIVRSRRQLVERGVEFDHVVGADLDRDLLAQLFSLHGIRSERVGRTTTFTAARLDFHERLASRSSASHCSFLVRARADGELVGALYGFADPTRLHYYQSGWDPSFERASLGSVLIGDAIGLAVERGATTFDLLRGDEPYKLRFGAEVVEDLSVLVARGTAGRVLAARDRLAERLDARRSEPVSP